MAKKLIVGHQSALLVYRAAGARIISPPEEYLAPVEAADCTTCISPFKQSGNVASLISSGTLDLVARDRHRQHSAKGCQIHVLTGQLPDNSFRDLGGNILVSSPALTLLQFCQDLELTPIKNHVPAWCRDLVEELGPLGRVLAAAEVASELCGIYSVSPNNGKLSRHAPFATKVGIELYLRACHRRRSCRLAHKAIRVASPLSASPRETQLFLAMTAPWPLGYGFPLPQANGPVVIDDQSIESDDDCKVVRFSDYFWKTKTLRNGRVRKDTVLEYDSDEYHTASAGITDKQLADQAERRDAIEAQGNHFLRLATSHTKDFESFDKKMRQLAKMLRIDLPERSTDELKEAQRFFELIFDSRRYKSIEAFR